jgi:hypothetical protein
MQVKLPTQDKLQGTTDPSLAGTDRQDHCKPQS